MSRFPNLVGGHLGGWRHKDAFAKPVMNLEAFIEMTEIAERGKLDAVFLADGNGVRDMDRPALFAANHPSARPAFFEPTTLLSAVAMVARRIGVVATATSTYDEPWMVARRFASMDHISKGRAGWNLVTASNAGDALNFGRAEHMGREDRYARAQEFYEVVASCGTAGPTTPSAGQGNRPVSRSRARAAHRPSRHPLHVKGPLNISPTPQGRPVVFMAGQSGPGMELAARYADALFGAGTTKQDCIDAYADIKGRMARYGRAPNAEDPAGRQHLRRPHRRRGRRALRGAAVADLPAARRALSVEDAGARPRGPAARRPAADRHGAARRWAAAACAATSSTWPGATTSPSARPTSGRCRRSAVPCSKAAPTQVADEMEDWWRSKAGDGFTIMAPVQPRGLRDFVDLVVPELQRRGIFRQEYETTTLRGHLGLPDAPSQWQAEQAAGERGAA